MSVEQYLKKHKIFRRVVFVVGGLLFIYLMIFFNLYKITKELNFNIFDSPALGKLFLFFVIFVPAVAIIEYILTEKKGKRGSSDQKL